MRYFLILFIFCIVLFSACSDKDKSVTGPNLGDDNWVNDYQKVLYVYYQQDFKGSSSFLAQIWIKGATDTDSPPMLSIKEIVCPLLGSETVNEGTWYRYTVPDPAMYDYGTEANYTFIFNTQTYTGTLTMPPTYDPSFPVYSINSDYFFYWQLENSPDEQWLTYSINYKDLTTFSFNKEIRDTTRSYTIPEEKLHDVAAIGINLQAFNICKNTSSLLVLTLSAFNHSFYVKGLHAKTQENNLFPGVNKKVVEQYMHH
jgi:hypothetical protein